MWKPAVCAKDCPDTCGLLAKVEQNRIVKVKGDPDHPYTQGFICKKAAHFPAHIHNPNRIRTPLKRTGPKGEARFTPVTWDEALDEIAHQMGQIRDAYGAEAILPYYYAGHMGLVQRNCGHAFFNRLGASSMMPTICGPAATAGFQASLGKGPSTEIQEAAFSDCIIIWGSNTLATNIHAWPHFIKARKNGARITVIDPYRSPTAKAADRHLMIRPGTDAALALAMMQVIIEQDLIDHEFMSEWTTGFKRFRERAAQYSPQRAAEICGIEAQAIVELALEFGRARAPYIRTGWGPARQLRGGMAMRTIALLPALVGAFSKKGGGITRSLGGAPNNMAPLVRTDLRPKPVRQINMVELGNALNCLDDPPVKLLYNYLSNPAVVAPQSRLVLQGLAREDLFVVVQEMFMTDTARFADIILPGASFFEVTDLYRSYGHNYIKRIDPVIPPVGQSRSTLSIFQSLAKRMGFEEAVFSLTEEACMEIILQDDSPFMEGVDIKAVMAGATVRLNIPASPYARGFNTPSGRVEFFSQAMADQGLDPLPDGEPLRDPDGGEDYPLEFITPPHPLLLNSAFNEIEAVREKIGSPRVLIHPETAAERQISQGDRIRVFNSRGSGVFQAQVTRDTQRDLLVAEGLRWPVHFPGGGANQMTSQRLTDMGETCAFHCNRVAVEKLAKADDLNADEKLLKHMAKICHTVAFESSGSDTENEEMTSKKEREIQRLFAYTDQEKFSPIISGLAEPFGLMLVKQEAREVRLKDLIAELEKKNMELEAARKRLGEQNRSLKDSLRERYQPARFVGQCPEMMAVKKLALSIAKRPINTLILGASGTGKEVFAKMIHFNSPRAGNPFIAINCTAIPETLFESEMFGIGKGVATGVAQRKGIFEQAHTGTIFLDEIGDMSLSSQAKLLRVLEEQEVMPVGGGHSVKIDVKIISATNSDLKAAVAGGKFREDLYYRLNVVEMILPLLKDRGEDILILAEKLLAKNCLDLGRQPICLSPAARTCLQEYDWPGNVRELNNEMERAAALTLGDQVCCEDLSAKFEALCGGSDIGPDSEKGPGDDLLFAGPEDLNLDRLKQRAILKALETVKGNKTQAAQLLGVTREGLRKQLLKMQG